MTLVEVAISSALLVAVLLVAVSTTQTMNQMIRTGEAESSTIDRVREVLYQIKQDLAASSLVPDAVSGVLRVQIEAAPNGGQRLRLRRVDGATLTAGSLVTVWSPWITWEMDATGAVWRTLDGETPRVVARGIASLAFQNHNGRVVSVTVRSADRAANGQPVTPVQLEDVAQPAN
jgi:hypothetical protein